MKYREHFCTALVLAATTFAAGAPAKAADLDVGEYRYRESYVAPAREVEVRRYEERRVHVREEPACLSRHELEHALFEDGWSDIDDFDVDGGVIRVEARRMDGDREFDLTVDRCSGRVIEAHPQADLRSVRVERRYEYRRY